MGFTDALKNFFLGNPKKIVHVPLNPDSVTDNTQVRAMSFENAEIKGENARLKNIIAQLKERETDKNEESNVKAELNEQRNELKLKSQGKFISQKKFWARYFRDTKFREKLGIYTFDRSTRLAGFGDLCWSEDGDQAIFDDKGNLVLKMGNLKDMIQSVGALGNDLARGMIPVNLDKEGGYIENIMIYEAPELIQTGDKLQFAKARKRPVYEIIKQLNEQISDLHGDLQEAEALNIELQNKIDKLTSQSKINQEMSETSRAELSHHDQMLTGIDRSFRMVQRDMLNYQNISAIQEDNIAKLESEVTEMREKAERQGVKLSDEKALELIQNIRSTVVNELPDTQERSQTPIQQGSMMQKPNR